MKRKKCIENQFEVLESIPIYEVEGLKNIYIFLC